MMRRLSSLFELLATVFLGGVLATVVLQVFFRYVAHVAVPWTEEATRYLGIWMVFMGAVAAVAQGSHIAVTVLVEQLPQGGRRVLDRLASLTVLGFLLIVFLGSLQLIRLNWEQQAVTFPVSVVALYVAVAVFSGVSLLILAGRLVTGSGTGD
jgi:TRAP-type C4-dicarboxylate transport system permease small subunit